MLKLLRVNQYIKNLFVFAPLFFTFDISNTSLLNTSIVFILFSLLASSIYLFNDLTDLEEDKHHPTKKHRPLASGKVNKSIAIMMIILLSGFSLVSSFFFNIHLFFVLLIYGILNFSYSLGLKNITIIDIFIIAIGFVLRLFAGSSVIDATLSLWIIIITFLLALFLALAKRRDDVLLASQDKKIRKNIDGYNLEFINATMVFMSGAIIVSYILYTVSDNVMTRLGSQHIYVTSLFVLLGIIRYMQITFVEENSGSPTEIALKDRFLHLTILGWLLSFIVIVRLI